jgi:16S rRNA (guanine966-N2)-methyltransferase
MRVIAGQWKGRKLRAGRGNQMRPTTDRVKEAVYSLLGEAVHGSEVVDLCCGAGGLGIEALSRGAERVYLVDRSAAALAIVDTNLATCRARPGTYIVVRAEVLSWLESYLKSDPELPVIILADPPYPTDLAHDILVALQRAPAGFPLRMAVVEHPSDVNWQIAESERLQCRRRRYGTTTLTILER